MLADHPHPTRQRHARAVSTRPRIAIDKAALDAADAACPVRRLMGRLAERWTGLVLMTLADTAPHRFCDLQREIGNISQKMLTQTLRGLESDGFVRRCVHATAVPRVDYRITALGTALLVPLGELSIWAHTNADAMQRGPTEPMDLRGHHLASATRHG
jgi:DNA-binding HxlR family transcriptional regulator